MSDALSYPFPEPPPQLKTLEVVPGIHWLRLPLPFALDHINVWLLADVDGWTLVDTGVGLDQTREHWQGLFDGALDGRPLKRIVVTHYHPDHIGQAAWLAEYFGLPVHVTKGEMDNAVKLHGLPDEEAGGRLAALFEQHGLSTEQAQQLRRRGNTYRKLVPSLPVQHVRLSEGDELAVGERQWRILIARGHAPEHACLYSDGPGGPVLIAGDQVLPRISSNVSVHPDAEDEDPLGEYLASLERFGQLPEQTLVLPSHGGVFRGLRPRCEALSRHHEEHLETLEDACAEPMTAADALPLLFRRELDAHQIMFAMGESIAHLRHLECRGRVERLPGEPVRFASVPR